MKKSICFFLLLSAIFLTACQSEQVTLRLATTTSTQDSGLMDQILPDFEAQTGISVDVIAVGTGEALNLGRSGDVDVVLVHAREQEEAFVAEGYGLERFDVMMNDFVLLGPSSDPVGIAGSTDSVAALAAVAAQQAPFISRGDNSGTHIREMALWEAAGIEPTGDWYQSVGQGMGAALTIADEQQAYILTDRGTFIRRQAENLGLSIMAEGDSRLMNPYGITAVNPALHAGIQGDAAQQFIDWMLSAETQSAIDAYRINGQQLFFSHASQSE